MTNAATGHALTGRNKGWRKAVRYALTENPVSDAQSARQEFEIFPLSSGEDRAPGRARLRRGSRQRHISLAYAARAI
jgi:hypothetical protein